MFISLTFNSQSQEFLSGSVLDQTSVSFVCRSADLHGMNFSLAHSESRPHVPTHTCARSALVHSPNSRGARCSNGRQMYSSSAACWVLTLPLPLASCSEIFLTGSTDACCFSFLFMHTLTVPTAFSHMNCGYLSSLLWGRIVWPLFVSMTRWCRFFYE